MGLDMYLAKRIYVGAEFDHRNVELKVDLKIGGKPIKVNEKNVLYITESACYWRKANHIHAWFVDHVQSGEDDCGEYYVSEKDLKELRKACIKVMEYNTPEKKKMIEHLETILPTRRGFFFGSDEYDDYYFETTNRTIKMIDKLLDEDMTNSEFVYRSSW